jgi:lipid-A-disaccharide synthase
MRPISTSTSSRPARARHQDRAFRLPSIWAWRAERIEKIRAAADHVLCIFPFEPRCWRSRACGQLRGPSAGQRDPDAARRAAARTALGSTGRARRGAAAGSRRSEVRYLASRFFSAAALMQQAKPAITFIAPTIPALRGEAERLLAASPMAGRIQLLDGQSHAALAACDATLIASGYRHPRGGIVQAADGHRLQHEPAVRTV